MLTTSQRALLTLAVLTALTSGATLWAQATPPAKTKLPEYVEAKHRDTQFAHELAKLGLTDTLNAYLLKAKGTPVESVFAADAILSQWDELSRDRSARARNVETYVTALGKYLDTAGPKLDPIWCNEHAKFILGIMADPIRTRVEYYGINDRDRAQLKPLADTALRLLDAAGKLLAEQMVAEENVQPMNKERWQQAYGLNGDVQYYRPFAQYFGALALPKSDGKRHTLLRAAAKGCSDYADGDAESGVKFISALLRGKCNSEAGEFESAINDLNVAATKAANNPEWLRYQASYQIVVARIRQGNFYTEIKGTEETKDSKGKVIKSSTATKFELNTIGNGPLPALKEFKTWIESELPKDNQKAALISWEMLKYRVLVAQGEYEATVLKDSAVSAKTKQEATALLMDLLQREPRFQDLIYDQLAAGIPDNADLSKYPPMQKLALAWVKSTTAQDDEPGRKQLEVAITAAEAVATDTTATATEKQESLLIAALATNRLGRMIESVQYNIRFAEINPKDKRSKDSLEMALAQIGQIRKANQGKPVSEEVQNLTRKALALMTGDQGDPRWMFAQGAVLEDAGKLDEAAKAFAKVPATEATYSDAQYRLLRITQTQLLKLTSGENKPDEAKIKEAAKALMAAADKFLSPPKNASPETHKKVEDYKRDVWIIQAITAVKHLKDGATALKALDQVEGTANAAKPIPTAMQGLVLRYRILALNMVNKTKEANELVKIYYEKYPQQAPEIIRGMVYEAIKDIDVYEKTEPERAKQTAKEAADLVLMLAELSKADKSKSEADRAKDEYAYRQYYGDMLIRGGRADEAYKLFTDMDNAFKAKNPGRDDIFNKMGQARALFYMGHHLDAHEAFVRLIPRLEQASESWWEAYLRVLQCNEKLGKDTEDTKKTLKNLKGSFPQTIGGPYKDDFMLLLTKYSIF
jgi:hypothetical protein